MQETDGQINEEDLGEEKAAREERMQKEKEEKEESNQDRPDEILTPIDTAIISSINSLESNEKKQKMLSSILLVGGSHLFPGFYDVLNERLNSKIQLIECDKLRIFVNPKELDSRILSWKGGSIFSRIEGTKDHWVSREEWTSLGVRCLRERAPFFW